MFALSTPHFVIRPLTAADSMNYRALRQKILHTHDARYFSDSYERERQLTEQEWLSWCTEMSGHCILGTFADSKLVGIIMITRQGSPQSPVVEWEAVWLDPRYRGIGIGRRAHDQALKWTQDQGYKFVVEFIRTDNNPGLNICKKQGFVYAYTIHNELWADGSVADTHAFLLDLRAEEVLHSSQSLTTRFQEAWPFLNQGLHAPDIESEFDIKKISSAHNSQKARNVILRKDKTNRSHNKSAA